MAEKRDTIPCDPPPEPSDWPGLDDDTASEAPRSLTPVPGSVRPKKRSGEWEIELPKPLPGIPPKLPVGAGRDR